MTAIGPTTTPEIGRPGVVVLTLALALCLAVAAPAGAQLATLQGNGVRLVYLRGSESYLVPHAARTFLNSLAFQKKLFGFEPSEEITVLLLDLEDSGNASATVVPRNTVTVQIAPLNFAFETIAGNDRMNIIMNHELVHVAAMDQAARSDRLFRRLFGGKVAPVAGAARVDALLLPDDAARRRAALVPRRDGGVRRHLDGRRARPRAGRLRRDGVPGDGRDGAPFYDPLGLVSEGTKIDFQLQVNSYLYGTRFMTWLARHLFAREGRRVDGAHAPGSRAYYAAQFRSVFGTSIEDAWADWIADERDVPAGEPRRRSAQYPLTPLPAT